MDILEKIRKNNCTELEQFNSYEDAVKKGVPTAAKTVFKFVNALLAGTTEKKAKASKLQKIHLIGHSLGSHVMGQAGKQIKADHDVKIGRITGLDPAAPAFYTEKSKGTYSKKSLHKNDALYVDVFHTNKECYGTKYKIGHMDI